MLDDPDGPDEAKSIPATGVVLEAARALLRTPAAADVPVMVLLIDDQAVVVEAIRQALAGKDHIDLHYRAHSGEAMVATIQTCPTVTLQDLATPDTSGLTLMRDYRANPVLRDVFIIVLSIKEEPVIRSATFTAGANDHPAKLSDRIELLARIRYHSRSFVNLLQRDKAYRALRQSQQQLLEANLELRRLTNSDGLTGLVNRRYPGEYLSVEWRRGAREGTTLPFLMIDVDNFKLYNDTYGHVAGDETLKRIGSTVEACLGRPRDLAACLGGEEFAVVPPGNSAEGLKQLAEKIRSAIEALQVPHMYSPTGGYVTVSIGGAVVTPMHDVPTTTLIEAADLALYQAKHKGKDCVAIGEDTGVTHDLQGRWITAKVTAGD